GYVLADGRARFPNAEWVPVHLRGAPVPDMREHLAGGAPSGDKVGAVFKSGPVVVPGFTVAGGNFTPPAGQPAGAPREADPLHPHAGGANAQAGRHFGGARPELWGVRTQNPGLTSGWNTIPPDRLRAVRGGHAIQGQQAVPAQTLSMDSARSNP